MRVVARIDAQGFFVEDVLLEDGERTPQDAVEVRPQEGFHRPKWTGGEAGAWVEGKAPAEILEEKKAQKVQGFAEQAISDLSPLFTDHQGKDETLHLAVGHIVKICQALGITPDPRLSEVVAIGQKALDKKQQVEAAMTEAELEAIQWT